MYDKLLFKNLKKEHLIKDPECFHAQIIIPLNVYDTLYENQNRFDSGVWKEFKTKHKIKCKFFNDISDIDLSKEIICLWFFKDRNDKNAGNDITLGENKIIIFEHNTFFITPLKKIKFNTRKRYFPFRPCVQIELTKEDYVNIKKDCKIDE